MISRRLWGFRSGSCRRDFEKRQRFRSTGLLPGILGTWKGSRDPQLLPLGLGKPGKRHEDLSHSKERQAAIGNQQKACLNTGFGTLVGPRCQAQSGILKPEPFCSTHNRLKLTSLWFRKRREESSALSQIVYLPAKMWLGRGV